VSETSVTCACDHLSDFATRFAALEVDVNNVFGQRVVLSDPRTLAVSPGIFVAVGLILVALIGGAWVSRSADAHADLRFAAALRADAEVSFLARVEAMQGRPWVLDRLTDVVTFAIAGGRTFSPVKRLSAPHHLHLHHHHHHHHHAHAHTAAQDGGASLPRHLDFSGSAKVAPLALLDGEPGAEKSATALALRAARADAASPRPLDEDASELRAAERAPRRAFANA
jgi:hypothetical protein